MIRANKGTPNENALRSMLTGACLCVLLLVGIDPAVRVYDEYLRVQPWLRASIEVLPQRGGGKPAVLYHVEAPAYSEGRWKSWPELENGRRLPGGEGLGTYGPRTVERVWDWAAFFEADVAVPGQPFRVCVSYTVRTKRGVVGNFGPDCSALYDPLLPAQ